MTACALLAEAATAGFPVRLDGDKLKIAAATPPDLLARLRERKVELLEVLAGKACRYCARLLSDADRQHLDGGHALPFGDGTAAHVGCYEGAEIDRIVAASQRAVNVRPIADLAEVTLRSDC